VKGSPADGVLEVDDVILGVGGKPFEGDARKAFGTAITEAEKTENKGLLKVIRWRKGKAGPATVPLKAMGNYSDTAPYDCPKSRRILEQGCRYLAERELGTDIVGEVNALALPASGKPEYLEKVKALAHKVGKPDLMLTLKPGMFAWGWGYANLFLTEYYLATGDESVFPAIREYSTTIAKGVTSTNRMEWSSTPVQTGAVGEGNIVLKDQGGYTMLTAVGHSHQGEYYKAWTSKSLSGFVDHGKIRIKVPAWASGAFGHGDVICRDNQCWLYFQGTSDGGRTFQIGLAKHPVPVNTVTKE
jgi:hypothetical protein